ncbi:D-isomer specific 2-hydroxyacid dehydrogenase family protein [Solirubrobacter taibaiensis]|nr:D-isomer specific 2-hydroxyacid dehydrogenase family protein [Solirubrobacter taibaiensis]
MPAPLIHVGPEPEDHLVSAVEDGGGRVVALDEAEGVIWAGGPDFPEFPSGVRWVQLPAAGVESWMDAVQAQPRIQFTSCAGAYATQVAEHALALLLAGVRGIVGYARTKTWDPGGDHVLEGSTVAIVGAGGIGRELIKMLEPHDVEVIAVTRSGRDGTLPVERLGEVWGTADHFVIAAPATDGTRHLVGADELAQMKPHSWIVNIARGALIDADALVEALREERIGGAALDVTEPEPLPDDHPLWNEPRALITPHVANPPETMSRDLAKRVTENVRRFGAGEDLLAPIERDRGY